MKKLFILMLFIILTIPIFAFTLKAGISYNVNTARTESFSNIKYKIDMSLYTKFLQDLDLLENQRLLSKNKYRTHNKKLVKFSDGSYSITYKNNKNVSFFYNSLGKLIAIQFKDRKSTRLNSSHSDRYRMPSSA